MTSPFTFKSDGDQCIKGDMDDTGSDAFNLSKKLLFFTRISKLNGFINLFLFRNLDSTVIYSIILSYFIFIKIFIILIKKSLI